MRAILILRDARTPIRICGTAAARALLRMRALPRPTRSPQCLGARAALARFRGALTPAISPPGGAGGLRSDSKMRADFPPGRPGVVSFGYGLIARHALRHRFPHACDRLSRPRQARMRPFPHRLGEILPVALPTGDELESGDDLLAPQAERRRDLVGAAARGLQRRQAFLALFRPGSRHRHSHYGDATPDVRQIPRMRREDCSAPARTQPVSQYSSGLHAQPLSSRSAICQITSMPGALSLRQGMAAKFSPPYFLKRRAFSMAISSSVSRQSAEKPGV